MKPERLQRQYVCDVCGKKFLAKRQAWLCGPTCRQRSRRDAVKRIGSLAWKVNR